MSWISTKIVVGVIAAAIIVVALAGFGGIDVFKAVGLDSVLSFESTQEDCKDDTTREDCAYGSGDGDTIEDIGTDDEDPITPVSPDPGEGSSSCTAGAASGPDFSCSGSHTFSCSELNGGDVGGEAACKSIPGCSWTTIADGSEACMNAEDTSLPSCSAVSDMVPTPGRNPEEICRVMGCTVDAGTFNTGTCSGDPCKGCHFSHLSACHAVTGCFVTGGPDVRACAADPNADLSCNGVSSISASPGLNPQTTCTSLGCDWTES